ncbi:MAG: hypothetical protein HY865_08805 [Chloroflexi bacterium]|nr:hypothetical protein [Chloroflexota bacterium]
MKRQLFFLLAVVFTISSCGKPAAVPSTTTAPPPSPTKSIEPSETPLPTVTPACISSEPAQKDIDRALAFTGEIFNTPNWMQSYTVNESNVAVLWQDAPQSALVYLEARIMPCGYEEPDLNREFSDENWRAIFANYESYKLLAECRNDAGLRLYQFETQNLGLQYGVNYWVKNDTDTRLIAAMLVFPLESKLLLDEYSSMLFPGYSSCP